MANPLHGAAPDGFSARLRAAIQTDTLRTFAEKAGISPSALHQYLTGKSEPSRPVLLALARAGGVSLHWLAGEEERPPSTVREAEIPYRSVPPGQRVFPTEFDPELLQRVIAAIDQVLAEGNLVLPVGKRSLLTTLAYADAWWRGGEVSREYVGRLVELAG